MPAAVTASAERSRVSRLVAAWTRYWFDWSTRYHYGVFRILFVVGFFLNPFLPRSQPVTALESAPAEFAQPVLLLRVLHLPLPPPSWMATLLVPLAILAALGVVTRVSLGLLAVLELYLGSAVNSYGFIAHDTTFPMLVLIVLVLSPGVSALSVDSYLRSRRDRRASATGFGAAVPVWPARLLLVLLALVYFSSGYQKVDQSGFAWANGKTLQAYITDPSPSPYFLQDPDPTRATFRDGVGLQSFMYSTGRPTGLAVWLARSDLAVAVLAAMSLLWELTFPVVLFVRRLLVWYLLVGVGFHVMIVLSFRLTSFYTYPLCYLVFVDWNRVQRWCSQRISRHIPAAQSPAG